MLQITSQLAGLGLNGNWSLYEKRLSIPGSASGVICNFGKSFLHLSFSFPHTHTKKVKLTIDHWLSSIRIWGDRILTNHLIWYIESGIPVREAWLQKPISLHPVTGTAKIFVTFLSFSLVMGNPSDWKYKKLHDLYSPLPRLLRRQLYLKRALDSAL